MRTLSLSLSHTRQQLTLWDRRRGGATCRERRTRDGEWETLSTQTKSQPQNNHVQIHTTADNTTPPRNNTTTNSQCTRSQTTQQTTRTCNHKHKQTPKQLLASSTAHLRNWRCVFDRWYNGWISTCEDQVSNTKQEIVEKQASITKLTCGGQRNKTRDVSLSNVMIQTFLTACFIIIIIFIMIAGKWMLRNNRQNPQCWLGISYPGRIPNPARGNCLPA